jgi:hypothetical protein
MAGGMNDLMIGLDYCIMMLKSLLLTSISFAIVESPPRVMNRYLRGKGERARGCGVSFLLHGLRCVFVVLSCSVVVRL